MLNDNKIMYFSALMFIFLKNTTRFTVYIRHQLKFIRFSHNIVHPIKLVVTRWISDLKVDIFEKTFD